MTESLQMQVEQERRLAALERDNQTILEELRSARARDAAQWAAIERLLLALLTDPPGATCPPPTPDERRSRLQ